jgi:hypothetical protein
LIWINVAIRTALNTTECCDTIIFQPTARRLMWINTRLSALAVARSKNVQNGDSLKGKLDPAQIG